MIAKWTIGGTWCGMTPLVFLACTICEKSLSYCLSSATIAIMTATNCNAILHCLLHILSVDSWRLILSHSSFPDKKRVEEDGSDSSLEASNRIKLVIHSLFLFISKK